MGTIYVKKVSTGQNMPFLGITTARSRAPQQSITTNFLNGQPDIVEFAKGWSKERALPTVLLDAARQGSLNITKRKY